MKNAGQLRRPRNPYSRSTSVFARKAKPAATAPAPNSSAMATPDRPVVSRDSHDG